MSNIDNLPLTELTDLRELLSATLNNFAKEFPDQSLMFLALKCWPSLANDELLTRAATFLKTVSTIELIAIANGQLDIQTTFNQTTTP